MRLPFIAAILLLFGLSVSARASDDNTLIEGAKLCTRYLPRHERQYGIPVHLLAAIASTESGRYHRALGLNLPWPWTINVEGKGYFFDNKEEAIAAVRKFQARGVQSIDVGCMQVNLHHHPYAFANLEQAFDPAYNVAYAAQFLKQNFMDEGSWRKATGDYHSRTPLFGEQYARLVFGAWNRIINKVADAQAGRPILNVASNSPAIRYHDAAAAQSAAAIIRRQASYHAPRMHEISISSSESREKGVLVIRPGHDAAPGVEQASLDEQFVSGRLSVDAAPVAADNKGAQIVKIKAGKVVSAKGQFEPESHIVHVNDTAAADAVKPPPSAFVFDN